VCRKSCVFLISSQFLGAIKYSLVGKVGLEELFVAEHEAANVGPPFDFELSSKYSQIMMDISFGTPHPIHGFELRFRGEGGQRPEGGGG
jgi:hypothetical protein